MAGVCIRYVFAFEGLEALWGLAKRTGPVERAGVLGASIGGEKTENENIGCELVDATWLKGIVVGFSFIGSSTEVNANVDSTLDEVGDSEPNSLRNDNGAFPGLRCRTRMIDSVLGGEGDLRTSSCSSCESLTTSSSCISADILFFTCVRAIEGGAMTMGGCGSGVGEGVMLLRGRVDRRKGVAASPSVDVDCVVFGTISGISLCRLDCSVIGGVVMTTSGVHSCWKSIVDFCLGAGAPFMFPRVCPGVLRVSVL